MFVVSVVMVAGVATSCADKKRESKKEETTTQDNSVPTLESIYALLQGMGADLDAPSEELLNNTGMAQVYDKVVGEEAKPLRKIVFAKNAKVGENDGGDMVYESQGDNGCVLEIRKNGTTDIHVMFRDSLDADDFYQQMVKRGMLRDEKDELFLTNGKIGSGIQSATTDELKNKFHATFHVSKPEADDKKGWYVGQFSFCQ